MPPSVGFQRRNIVADLERYLLTDGPWEADDGDTPDASINARAVAICERFRQSGWLRQERVVQSCRNAGWTDLATEFREEPWVIEQEALRITLPVVQPRS